MDTKDWDSISLSDWRAKMKGVHLDSLDDGGVPLIVAAMRCGRGDLVLRLISAGASVFSRDSSGKGLAEAFFRMEECKNAKAAASSMDDLSKIFDVLHAAGPDVLLRKDASGLPPIVSGFMSGNWAAPVMDIGVWFSKMWNMSSFEDWRFDGMDTLKNGLDSYWLRGMMFALPVDVGLSFLKSSGLSADFVPAGGEVQLGSVWLHSHAEGWDRVKIPEEIDPLSWFLPSGESVLISRSSSGMPKGLLESLLNDVRFLYAKDGEKWTFSGYFNRSLSEDVLSATVYQKTPLSSKFAYAPLGDIVDMRLSWNGNYSGDSVSELLYVLKKGFSAPSLNPEDFPSGESLEVAETRKLLALNNEAWRLLKPESFAKSSPRRPSSGI